MGSRIFQSVLGAMLVVGFASGASAEDKEVVVGFAVAESGMFQPYDVEGMRMAAVAIDALNAKGGVLGHKIKTVVADTKSDRVEGARAGKAVLNQGAKLVVVTCDYDFGAPAAMQANRAGVIAVSLCAGDPKMGPVGVGPLAFSAGMAGPSEGVKIAEWAFKNKGWKNAYVLTDTLIEYNKSVCSGFEWQWKNNGGTIAGSDTFRNGDPSISGQVTRLSNAIKDKNVDFLVMCSFLPGGATALRQIRAAGIDLPIMSGQAMAGTFWLDSVPGLSNFYTVQQATTQGDPRPGVQEIVAAYEKRYGEKLNQIAAIAIHPWLGVWADAVEQAGSFDGRKVVEVLNSLNNKETPIGPYSYTPQLHILDAPEQLIVEIQDGKTGEVVVTPPGPRLPENVLYRIGD